MRSERSLPEERVLIDFHEQGVLLFCQSKVSVAVVFLTLAKDLPAGEAYQDVVCSRTSLATPKSRIRDGTLYLLKVNRLTMMVLSLLYLFAVGSVLFSICRSLHSIF